MKIEYYPLRIHSSVCSRLPGGIFKSPSRIARSTYSGLRAARLAIFVGNYFALLVVYFLGKTMRECPDMG